MKFSDEDFREKITPFFLFRSTEKTANAGRVVVIEQFLEIRYSRFCCADFSKRRPQIFTPATQKPKKQKIK